MHPNTPSTGTNTQKDGKTRAAVRYAAVMQVDEHKGAAMTNLSDIEKRCEACPFCGDDNLSVVEMTYMHADGPTKGRRIKCQTCGAQAPDTAWNLRAQVQDLQSKLATTEGLVALQQEQIGGMQRKMGELEVDARRYRFLRDPASDVALVIDKPTGICGDGSTAYEYRAGVELDAAIDAALNTETTG